MSPEFFREVIDLIAGGDWERHTTQDGKNFYYVGANAFWQSLDSGRVLGQEIQVGGIVGEKPKARPRPQLEKHIRALVAGPQPNYLETVKARFVKAGLSVQRIEAACGQLLGDKGDAAVGALRELTDGEREGLAEYLEALLATEAPSVEAAEEYRGELEFACQKFYLWELAGKYKKLLRKLGRLSPLPFEDRQLEEATRCWLYGFCRAAIVLSASALEYNLKVVTDVRRVDSYRDLVAKAKEQGKLTGPYEAQAMQVFQKRNAVVHEANDPRSEEAEEVLLCARCVVKSLLGSG
jgi:hypothetical protein